jgi:hypothetical protein
MGMDVTQAWTPRSISTHTLATVPSPCSTGSRYTRQGVGLNSGVTLASVDPVAQEAGKAHEGGASHLETQGPLDGDLSHDP